MVYEDRYCSRCTNWKDLGDGRGFGCPIWDMHFVHNGTQEEQIKLILESFIPTKDNGFPDKCVMFNRTEDEIEGQLHFGDKKEGSNG